MTCTPSVRRRKAAVFPSLSARSSESKAQPSEQLASQCHAWFLRSKKSKLSKALSRCVDVDYTSGICDVGSAKIPVLGEHVCVENTLSQR